MTGLSKIMLLCQIAFACVMSFAQTNSSRDPVKNLNEKEKADTNTVKQLNHTGKTLMHSNPDTAITLFSEALITAEKIDWQKGIAMSLGNLGVGRMIKADYSRSLDCFYKGLAICERLKNKQFQASFLGNIGTVYLEQEQYAKALDCFYKGLKFAEELKDKKGVLTKLGNIGNIYAKQSNYPTALNYYHKALRIAEEIGDINGIARNYGNMGGIYVCAANVPDSGESSRRQLLKKAFVYYSKAATLARQTGDKSEIARHLGNLGLLSISTEKYAIAQEHLTEALKINKEIGALHQERDAENFLSQLYDKTKRHKLALDHFRKFISLRDSLASEENTKKQTQLEMQYAFDKKITADSIKNAEARKLDDLNHQSEIRNQRQLTYAGAAGFLMMVIVAGISFRAFRNKKKANEEIARQKAMVEEKQKEILDSIYYARRIQKALIASEKYIHKNLSRLK